MKKIFSLLGLILVADVFTYAAIIKSAPEPAELADGNYYLYNEETGLYMSRGATWGTACTADYFGVPANLAFRHDDSKIVFYDWVGTGLGADLFTDNLSPATFTFIGSAEEGYAIFCETLNGGAGCVSVDAAGKPLKVEAKSENASKWKLVAREDYEKAVADAAAKIKADAFTAAGVDETKLATDYKLVDVTYLVQSAALKGGYSGWTWTPEPNRGGNLTSDENGTECFQGVGVLSQTVSGLQPGLYEVGIQTLYRDGSNANCGTMFDAGYRMANGYLSANGNKVRFADWASEATDSYSKPNSMAEYKAKADALGAYKISTFAVVGSDGKLEISLNQPNWINGGWWIFSNVTLTQYAEKGAKITPKFSVKVGTETFAIGETDTITVTSESDGAITFKSLDETVATVADNVATGVAVGTAKIAIAQAETETYVAMADTVEIPVTEFSNITDKYIVNGRFLDGANGWTCSFSPGLANNGHIGALEAYAGYNSIELASFKMTQDIVLPSGQYRLTSNAFYRYGLKYDVDPSISEGYMVCGTNKTKLPTLGSIPGLASYANDMAQALAAFENGLYSTYTDFKVLEDGTVITVGYEGTFPIKQCWFISGPLKLERTGDVSVEGYIDDLQAALATAPEGMMEKSLRQAITDAATVAQVILAKYNGDPTSVTAKAANDACEALKVAINNAEPSVKIYKGIKDAADKAQALDEDGQKKFDELIADVRTAYYGGTITDGVAELAAINAALVTATKAQTTVGSDWSLLGSTDKSAWTGATGNYANCVEKYADNGFGTGNILTQTISGLLPYAKYEVKFTAVANVARNLTEENWGAEIAQVFANETVKNITVENQSSCTPTDSKYQYTLEGYADKDGNLTFGLKNVKAGGQWYVAQFTSLVLKAQPATANMTVVEDVNWGTFYAPFDVTLPEGAFAYTITVEYNKTVRNKVADGNDTENNVIPANTAVLVYSATAINKNFSGVPVSDTPAGLENALVGTLEPIASGEAPANAYYLAKKNDVLNFYLAGEATLAANRAYLVLPAGVQVKGLFDVEATGINNVNINVDSMLRNIQGLPVSKSYKGFVIENGKKYLKK